MFGPNTLSLTALLALIVSLGPLSTDTYVVIIPLLPGALNTTINIAQLTMTVFLIAWAIAQLFAGALADRIGRKPVMLGGLAFFLVASVACVYATSIEALIIYRFVQALGASTAAVLPRAIVRDLHNREDGARMLGYMGTLLGFMLILGPVLGSYVSVWHGWQAIFWLMIGFSVLTMGLVLILFRESLTTPDPRALNLRHMGESFVILLSHRVFLGHLLTYSFVNGAMFTYFTVSSFIIVDLMSIPTVWFGYYFGGTMVGYVLGSFFTGRFSQRIGVDRLLKGSVTLAAITGIITFALAWFGINHVTALVMPMFALMFAFGCFQPLCFASALEPFPTLAGRAAALLGFGQMTFASGGSFISAILHDGTAIPSMAVIMLSTAASFIVFRILLWHPRWSI